MKNTFKNFMNADIMVSKHYAKLMTIQSISLGGIMKKNIYFPEGKIISINDINLEVFEAGQENIGNPIILCHGWPQHAYSWRHQVAPLVQEGYHVIIPNQRGYGLSSTPNKVEDYDLNHLTGDLVALLDYYQYEKAIFVGHDWGSTIVWGMALLHPNRVHKMINLSVPYLERGPKPWVEFLNEIMGPDHYMVHFNQYPGLADAIFDQHASQFLNNLFRKNLPKVEMTPGMSLINLAKQDDPAGDPIMDDSDLEVFVSSFKKTGFKPSVNWYRNLDRNWHILETVDPIVHHPVLMIYGKQDPVLQFDRLSDYVPHVKIATLDCGHWIQEEKPEEANQLIIEWLKSK